MQKYEGCMNKISLTRICAISCFCEDLSVLRRKNCVAVQHRSYPTKLQKSFNRELRQIPERPWAEIPQANFQDADYSPLLVHLSCKLLSREDRQGADCEISAASNMAAAGSTTPCQVSRIFVRETKQKEDEIQSHIPVAFYALRILLSRAYSCLLANAPFARTNTGSKRHSVMKFHHL